MKGRKLILGKGRGRGNWVRVKEAGRNRKEAGTEGREGNRRGNSGSERSGREGRGERRGRRNGFE